MAVALAAGAVLVALLVPLLLARLTPEPALGAGQPRFAADELTWAQGSTIHYGAESFDVGPRRVHEMLRTPYGFFLGLSESARPDAPQELAFFDGDRLQAVPGDVTPADVAVSPDGRYAGWVDRHGPVRLAGRIQEVVVVDLVTGEVAFRDHDRMGGGLGDDLEARYENLPPTFLGFDEQHAYWLDAEGHGTRWRVDLADGTKEKVEPDPDSRVVQRELGQPWNPRLGRRTWLDGGVATDDQWTGDAGFLSPDGRIAVRTSAWARLSVTVADSGRPVRLDHGRRNAWFAGWLGPDTVVALVSDELGDGYDPTVPDTTTGALVSCRLPSGHCTDLQPLTGLLSVVLGYGGGGWLASM